MKVYEKIKEMLCDELEDIAKQKELSPSNMDMLDTAIDIMKDISVIQAMELEYPSDGYSRDGGYSQGYYRQMPYYIYDDPGMMTGSSYARGRGSNAMRDSRGRYYENGYSRDTKEELEKLMHTAENDREREAIRTALSHIER